MNVLQEIAEGDPIYLQNLTGKSARIETINKEVHEGIIYVVDPVSRTIAIIETIDKKKILKLLMHEALVSLVVLPERAKVTEEFLKEICFFGEDIENQKVKLKHWFKKNLIDVTEDGDLLRSKDDFSIGPPYTIDQCIGGNTVILERMIALIHRMP